MVPAMLKKLLRLNVGSGHSAGQVGVINGDLHSGRGVDVIFDANKPWPFKDDSIGAVHAIHSLEHLSDPATFFAEAWRVLYPSPMSNLYVNVPYGVSDAGFGDLTHVRHFVPASFCCFQPGYNDWARNPQYDTQAKYFSIMSVHCMVDPALRWLLWPVVRRWGVYVLRFIYNAFDELRVTMRALKTPQDVALWRSKCQAGIVPVSYAMERHSYENRPLRMGETPEILHFGPWAKLYGRET